MASSCVLRAADDNFQPSDFLRDSPFQPCRVYCKGGRRSASRLREISGITVDMSSKADFSDQVHEGVFFLANNRAELLRLRQFTGIEKIILDFGVNEKDGFLKNCLFPLELIYLASEFALELELSIYVKE